MMKLQKKAHVLEGSMKEEEDFRSKQEDTDLLVMDEVVPNTEVVPNPVHHPKSDQTMTKRKELQENERSQIQDYFLSESESLGHSWTSEDSEVDWSYLGGGHHSPVCSDDSISDDDSLIEIALPDGHFVGHKEEEEEEQEQEQEDDDNVKPRLLHNKLPELAPESIFRQQSLMELLAEINEMNEEENLIEIDISMGSIKCSRFEIEA